MKNYTTPQNPQEALRAALGPGFQSGGATDAMLRTITDQAKRVS